MGGLIKYNVTCRVLGVTVLQVTLLAENAEDAEKRVRDTFFKEIPVPDEINVARCIEIEEDAIRRELCEWVKNL